MRLLPLLASGAWLAGFLGAQPPAPPDPSAPTPLPTSTPVPAASGPTAKVAQISIGDRVIGVPFPAGFERIDNVQPELDKALTQTIPPTNRLVAFFGLKSEWDLTLAGMPAAISRTQNAQVVKQLERQEIGTRGFGAIKQAMRAEAGNIEKSTAKAVADLKAQGKLSVGSEGALDFSNIAFLGYTVDDDTRFGYTLAFKLNVQQGTAAAETRMIASMVLVTVNGRHLMLYANSPYVDEDSRKWCETAVADWARAVVAANPKVEGPAPAGLDFGRAAMAGALGGAIAVLVFAFLRKNQTAG